MPVVLNNQPPAKRRDASPKPAAALKREVSPPMLIALAILAAAVLGLLGWRMFGESSRRMEGAEVQAHNALKAAKEDK
jgi:hypothetical protein